MGTFRINVNTLYMIGMVILVPWMALATNITTIFLVGRVNLIIKAPDVPMFTFGTKVIKVNV
jgi:hypothetical protein